MSQVKVDWKHVAFPCKVRFVADTPQILRGNWTLRRGEIFMAVGLEELGDGLALMLEFRGLNMAKAAWFEPVIDTGVSAIVEANPNYGRF